MWQHTIRSFVAVYFQITASLICKRYQAKHPAHVPRTNILPKWCVLIFA